MSNNHRSNSVCALVCAAAAFVVAFGLENPSAASAQTQTYPCETVLQFGTGMSTGGAKLRPGSVDSFFRGTSANFPDLPDAYVVTDPPAAWIANSASDDSQWIGPSSSVADDAAGVYVYRLQFSTPCAGALVTGRYAASDRGVLRLNGAALSSPTPATGYNVWTPFSFSNLPAGNNTLEFYVTNTVPAVGGPAGPTGLRAELTATATCCPCIELACPPDIFVTTCSNSAPVNFTVSGTNRCYTNLNITCRLAVAGANIPVTSGSLFPAGTNTVVCAATDTVGHTTNCTFKVIVHQDSQPPELHCPRGIFYLCSVDGTNVHYDIPVTDDTDPAPLVTCSPPSGSFFPAGTNTVFCEARDACGRMDRCSFKVIIAPDGLTSTYQAGVADNFLPFGLEAPSPGLCLGGSGYWNGLPFDTSWPGRNFSHSWQGLSPNLAGARLILHMKPTLPASLDDMLRIGLQNCGGAAVWTFAQPISSLPGAGGTWNTNPPTTFVLDLAALPGGVDLLPQLNADHRIEFTVGTETMVDYARLEVTRCGPTTTLSGVPYSLQNAYPIHRGEGVSWRTVNSNDPPIIQIDPGHADGFRLKYKFDFEILPNCTTIGSHHGLSTVWPTGEGTTATLGINPSPLPGLTRITLAQPSNMTGKAIEVWNGGQLVTRYFLAGNGDTAVNAPSSACLFTMGFTTAYYFASFTEPVSIQILTGTHVSGQAGGIATGDTVRMYFVLTASAPSQRQVRLALPPGGLDLSGMSLLHQENWVDGFGPQEMAVSDVIVSSRIPGMFDILYGNCIDALPGWSVELQSPVPDFCEFDGIAHNCTGGHVDVNLKAYGGGLNFGGLRLTPTLLPLEVCRIDNTVINSSANSVVITRTVGSPVTLNNVTSVETLHWPVKVSGNAGPQSFVVDLPPDTTVTAAGQTYNATRVTFNANPLVLGEFYKVCVETVDALQISMKSLSAPPPTPPMDCLTLNCPTNVIVNCTNGSGTVVTFNPTGATRCGSNVVITCEPPSGSAFPPGTSVVLCSAIDSQGNQDQCRFLVTVRDVTAPQLVIPARVIAPCTSPRGAVVDFASGARDHCDPSPVVVCEPPSGSVFPVGTNYVNCIAVDAGGNRSSTEFPVIVAGGCGTNRCLEIIVPEDIETPCNTAGGAIVSFIATAKDNCTGGAIVVACNPPSGSLFAVGVTSVICTTPAGASQASAGFLVEVTDVEPPRVDCPTNIIAAAQSPLGAVVVYLVSARDDCDPAPRIRCSPPSGSVFPVGETRVLCEAADAYGNISRCVFVVTVQPPDPLMATRLPDGRVELRWVGAANVESTEELSDDPIWRRVLGSPIVTGLVRSLILPIDSTQKFFRILPLPLLPPADRDGDGVPDERDRCPETPPGLAVDEFGCASFDLVASADLALGPEQEQLRKIRATLHRWPSVSNLVQLVPNPDVTASSVPALLLDRQLPQALVESSNAVRSLDMALMAFIRAKALRQLEIERMTPTFDAEHADVRNEDHEMMELEQIEENLTDSYNRHHRTLLSVSNVVRAIGNVLPRERVRIESIDSARGVAVLDDGRQLLLPKPGTPGAPPLDSILDAIEAGADADVEISRLPDGSLFGNSVSASAGMSGTILEIVNPRRLDLRITPVDFGLPDFDFAPRHRLKAYKWGFTENLSHHFFEFGQAFVAVPFLSSDSAGSYKHWLKIDADPDHNGTYTTLVQKLDHTSKPFVLKASALPEYTAFNIRIREYRAPVLAGGGLGQSEVLHEEVQLIELNRVGLYAEAFYDRTAFDLDDSPSETGHGVARVNDIARRFPLTLKPLNEMTFSGASYKATGNSSSYPGVQSIGFNDPFAVHFRDPNFDLFFANPDDLDKGIYSPTLKGQNHGKPFAYRVRLPFIARDRLHDCPGEPDTFYKIPFSGVYSVSQGNNGTFTHNGWQRFAWDFPKAANTTVRAARGGTVVDMRESSSQSCWNAGAQACQNCTGSASPNFVRIRHRDGTVAWYGHFRNNSVFVNLNQRVYRGTPLGGVGTTGCSTGNHLHLHVVDPDQTTTIPLRFESYVLAPFLDFRECYLPPSNSAGISTQ